MSPSSLTTQSSRSLYTILTKPKNSPKEGSQRSDSFQVAVNSLDTLRASNFGKTWLILILSIVSLCLFAVVIILVQLSYMAETYSARKVKLDDTMKINVSTMLSVLRAVQAVLSATTSMALGGVFSFLQWSLMNSSDGLPYLNLLALSSATGNIGSLKLLVSRRSGIIVKFGVLMRVGLYLLIWLSGVVLFFRTSLITVYDTIYTYQATAGVGPFNSTLVEPFLEFLQGTAPDYPYAILPYTYYAAAYTLVLNPLISSFARPVNCSTVIPGDCMSYLFTGGLEMVSPWAPENYTDYPLVKIDNTPSIQMDFSGVYEIDAAQFPDDDCEVYGDPYTSIGIQVCLTQELDIIRAGLFLCNGTVGGVCGSLGASYNMTTRVSFFELEATVIAARSNYSIMSTADTTTPVPITDIDLPSYRAALTWLLNYTAAAVPAPSSIVESFWSSNMQLGNPSSYGILIQNFQSVLAFPFWLFNDNNWGNTALRSNVINVGMPERFYTDASIVGQQGAIKIDKGMFGLFLAFQGLAMLFIWSVLLWVWFGGKKLPCISSFPLFDISYKAQVMHKRLTDRELAELEDSEVINAMGDAIAIVRPMLTASGADSVAESESLKRRCTQ